MLEKTKNSGTAHKPNEHQGNCSHAASDFGRAHLGPENQIISLPVGSNLGGAGAQECHETRLQYSPGTAEIIQLHRMSRRLLKAELKLVLQAQAICRSWTDGDKVKAAALWKQIRKGKGEHDPRLLLALKSFLAAIPIFEEERKPLDMRLAKLAAQHPLAGHIPHGFGVASLAQIIGECGDIASYRNPSCLWKRMGLAVIDGQRQHKSTNAEEAERQGYAPHRRALAYVIGDNLIKAKSPIVTVYSERKAKKIADGWSKLHAHRDAKMFMIKRVLLNLWVAARERTDEHIFPL